MPRISASCPAEYCRADWSIVNIRINLLVLLTLIGHERYVWRALWNPAEDRIVTGSGDGTVRVWDAATGEELLKIEGHRGWVTQVAWGTAGERILSAGVDGMAYVWDAVTGAQLFTLASEAEQPAAHLGGVRQAKWNANADRILTSGEDKTVRLWRLPEGTPLTLALMDRLEEYRVKSE